MPVGTGTKTKEMVVKGGQRTLENMLEPELEWEGEKLIMHNLTFFNYLRLLITDILTYKTIKSLHNGKRNFI